MNARDIVNFCFDTIKCCIADTMNSFSLQRVYALNCRQWLLMSYDDAKYRINNKGLDELVGFWKTLGLDKIDVSGRGSHKMSLDNMKLRLCWTPLNMACLYNR